MATKNNEQPVTHVVDATTMKDPVGDNNAVLSQVQQLFGETPPKETIRRAPIYDNAKGNNEQVLREDNNNVADRYSGDYDNEFGTLDLSVDGDTGEDRSSTIDVGEYLQPQQRPEQQQTEQPIEQDPGFDRFKQDFERYLGMPLEQTVQMVQGLQQFQVEQTTETRLRQIADEWGVNRSEAMARMNKVDERYRALDQTTREILAKNPIRGAQLIWQQLEKEAYTSQPNIPNLDRSKTDRRAVEKPRGSFTKGEIAAMSNDEYRRRQGEILNAYAQGLVFDN